MNLEEFNKIITQRKFFKINGVVKGKRSTAKWSKELKEGDIICFISSLPTSESSHNCIIKKFNPNYVPVLTDICEYSNVTGYLPYIKSLVEYYELEEIKVAF